MAEGKWIDDLTGATPLVDAARHVLALRLKTVHTHLPLALHQWQHDAEHVHQLRVGTRRAGAALTVFESCLPRKTFKKVRKHLRDLRRAAGDARDWDVFAEALAEREQAATAKQRPGLDFLIGYSQGQRVAAQTALAAASPNATFDAEQWIAATLGELRPPHEVPAPRCFAEVARPWLADVARELHAAATSASEGEGEDYQHLHNVRIIGKRLRYGVEIFAGCFDSTMKGRYYPLIEEMQEILGRANDSHIACQRLALLREVLKQSRPAEWKRFQGGIDGLSRYHQRRLPEQRRQFLKWRSRWRDSAREAALGGLAPLAAR